MPTGGRSSLPCTAASRSPSAPSRASSKAADCPRTTFDNPVAQSLNPGGAQRPFLALRFQLSAFQPFSVSLRGQSSNVRRVCCWREVIWIRAAGNGGAAFSVVTGRTYGLLGAIRIPVPKPVREPNRWGYEFCQRGALEHSGRSCRTDGNGVTLRTCWSANPQVGFREMLVDCIRSHSPFPLNEHRRKAPTWGPPRIPECM